MTDLDASPASHAAARTAASAQPAPVHPAFVNDRAAEWLGVEVLRAEYGDVLIRMQVRDEMLNGFGIAQGGMVFAFADVAFALACNDPHGDGSTITVASGVDINFMSPGFAGKSLTASATLVSTSGRSGLFDIRVTQETTGGGEDIVAVLRGRSRTIPNPAARNK
ncbi:putative phenylacetic acid degradation protein PaaI [Arthrobacter crystallopoietes BAB-32]|uniref:Putative phenylacetic acid degradation protein PaaI n=1 Tax=Arthrobacter crystallopoietes BAB-32 TaxID=1246476 RepID=N1UVZ0_9MICC|nr:hotdog fold thioesterase [Arthrobacter crystallopoietes]EMY34571.1 putative phenylacetic acid degradation protein PaaI [Arthrobacter crystallopoietes BAB-32]